MWELMEDMGWGGEVLPLCLSIGARESSSVYCVLSLASRFPSQLHSLGQLGIRLGAWLWISL